MIKTLHLIIMLFTNILNLASSGPVLRYKKDSCNTLEPVYVSESWAYPGGGDDSWQEEGGKGLFDSPRRSSDRSPPFSIQIDFDQYRRNREYTVRIETSEYYDSFLLQARGKEQADGNASLVGWFVTVPQICKNLHCLQKRKSSVVDKGRPIKLSNLTFTWRAPPTDYGPIRFVASIAHGNQYNIIQSELVSFNNFPMSIRGCGRQMSCFRSCSSSPTCDPEVSDSMVVTFLSGDEKYVVASLGGVVENENKYIAMGFGEDKLNLRNLDIAVCTRKGQDLKLDHFLVENKLSQPYIHRDPLDLTSSDVDTMRNFVWCQYRRPLRPLSMWDLDLSQPLYHFFFHGEMNGSLPIIPDEPDKIWVSPMRRNFTEIMNDIMFSGGSSKGSVNDPGTMEIILIMILSPSVYY